MITVSHKVELFLALYVPYQTKKGVQMINASRYTKELRESGFSKEQAEGNVRVLMEVMDSKFATKQDVEMSQLITKSDIHKLRTEVKSEIQELRTEVKTEIQELRAEMKLIFPKTVAAMGGMMVAAVTALAIIIKL